MSVAMVPRGGAKEERAREPKGKDPRETISPSPKMQEEAKEEGHCGAVGFAWHEAGTMPTTMRR